MSLVSLSCSGSAEDASQGDIVIAAIDSPVSPLNPEAAATAEGVRAAVARINAAGGVKGRKLRVTAHQDECSATSGATAAEQVVATGASLAVGHICSSSALAAATVYARHEIMLVSTGARHARLTENRRDRTTFRLAGRDDRFGADAAAWLAETYPGARIALVHDKSREARMLADAVVAALGTRAMTPVLRDIYVAGEREYNAVAKRLVASGADIAIIPAQPIEAAIIFARWRAEKPDALLLSSPLIAVPEFNAMARDARERVIVMLPTPRAALREDEKPLTAAHRRSAAEAAVEAWAEAARLSPDVAAKAIAERMREITATTRLGQISFDERGDARITSFVAHVPSDAGWRPWTGR